MRYGVPLLSIAPFPLPQPSASAATTFTASYVQTEQSPDFAFPATVLMLRPVTWTSTRQNVAYGGATSVSITVGLTRSPDLRPLGTAANQAFHRVWCGETSTGAWTNTLADPPWPRVRRADVFGVPAFRFEDVELFGFRIELPDTARVDAALERLVQPLNHHLGSVADAPKVGAPRPPTVSDYRYRAATRTIIVELLRYGRMKLRSADAPLGVEDFQSQHELVVRVLVGRVDDDTAQARDAAVFVPAIFVDNPWSKVLGRDVQGFDKRMASFGVTRRSQFVALRPDGRLAADAPPTPLADVTSVSLVERMGRAVTPLVEIGYSSPEGLREAALEAIDIDIALDASALAAARWQQSDFSSVEFRRSFARAVVPAGVRGFRSIQVAPVAAQRQLGRTLISGTFTLDDPVRYARPRGIATLTVHNAPTSPPGWQAFCDVLGIAAGQPKALPFPTGNWYRMLVSMTLDIENTLD